MTKTENNKKIKQKNIISQSEAGKIAGVSRQAINGLKDRYDFFVGGKVDINSDSWQSYLYERGIKSTTDGNHEIEPDNVQTGETIPEKKTNKKQKRVDERNHSGNQLKVKPDNYDTDESESFHDTKKYSLTGGFNPADHPPRNLADIERLAKIKKLEIEMKQALGELVIREMIEPALETIGQTIQSHLIDYPRKMSNLICKKLDRMGMEKEVEKILSPPLEKGIAEVKKSCEKVLIKDH